MQNKRVSFITLGCKVNFSESSSLEREFENHGYQMIRDKSEADIYVVNTCAVTSQAEKKCRTAIRKARKLSPDAIIVAAGCMSQLRPDSLANMPEVNIVLGSSEKFDVLSAIEQYNKKAEKITRSSDGHSAKKFYGTFSSGDRTRVFLKIQDGCDHFCNYCTIPYARGSSRSDTISNTVKLAKKAALETKAKEIVLTGINIGDFGKHNNESLAELLEELCCIEEIERLRLSSIEPELLSPEIIRLAAANPKLMPHFHIPLQSGSDKVLKEMNRKYDTAFFKNLIDEIRHHIPHACIASDIISAYPTETETDFQETLSFLEPLNISFLHVFPYSPRPATASAGIKAVYRTGEIRKRTNILLELSEKKKLEFYKNNIGREEKVLFGLKAKNGVLSGFTENYIEVISHYRKEYAGNIIPVKLVNFNQKGVFLTD